MMYRDKFVVAVKHQGRILREKEDKVMLPFGSEYSILLKNLNSNKASVKISIDGKDVLFGKSLLIDPNSSLELDRFVESLDSGNRFKFIQKTKEIIKHRGDRIDDGIIRVEFSFEQMTKHINVIEHMDHYHHHYYDYYPYYPRPLYPYPWVWPSGDVLYKTSCSSMKGSSIENVNCFMNQVSPSPDEGITVKGSQSNQHFHEGYIGELDSPEVIIIKLIGITDQGEEIQKPLTVKDKLNCETCGRVSESNVTFCSNCGTALV